MNKCALMARMIQAIDAVELERCIDHQALLLHTAETPEQRRAAWAELTRLHAMRSPEKVAAMEAERGLR